MNTEPDEEGSHSAPIGVAGWTAIVVLCAFLAATIWYAVHAWTRMDGVNISPLGWLFMGLGIFFTLGLGGVLMGLVFYSSRKNFDQ